MHMSRVSFFVPPSCIHIKQILFLISGLKMLEYNEPVLIDEEDLPETDMCNSYFEKSGDVEENL